MDSEVLIEVNQLSRHYFSNNRTGTHDGHSIAVDSISFTLQRGEVLGFLGPNGAGKSTTMQMLTGNLAPSHGSIKIAGIDLMDNPIEAKAKIGYLPDTPPLYKELSVDEYLIYCAQLNRIPKAEINSAMHRAKERCGLSEYGQRIINNLSKGYQQRVGIAQAIIHSPDIVILDEPTVGLDPIQMIEIRKLIKELGESHSVMISSHILPEIQTICNNVQIINQGKLILNASIEQLNQHMQTQTLRISCTNPVDIQKITALESINDIKQEGDTLILHCALIMDEAEKNQTAIIKTAQQIIDLASQHQWGLYEIFSEKQSLEDIFMSLTAADPLLKQEQRVD
ncbi:MAG: ABC transporter ATP-binding protein [gamma proteobacterium symbiont of Bathyaustriella thionipta]|nr:ABC transporter ATP-binding protein [gamma proteobacterium symbiont of Bathyaustriella thionipta]MCU7948942.1 ABC transporter ATP-binding protein [gamma proteobacterium symbiont of Bathyaustriella thionipta]MCU7953783.1 ABC transporter ATP-binding protein [gamma proteobacterium symbiont of Bathyaustriella thionipta]MCU7955457.1 ABC transporter ATP-binding protein [gamma proteobacterium symbiont of Bathyaustriella thionipta]MCU7966410.1 ABC transporter ATP-binding protein [gamma proteobacteri